jgi:acyl-CoA thioesterase
LEEAEAVCRQEGLAFSVTRTVPPREFAGEQLRVVRARQGERMVEILVASFQAAQDATP